MTSSFDHFAESAKGCLVHVSGGPTRGSGFYIAPGFVATCAHVAGAEIGARVSVRPNRSRSVLGATVVGASRAGYGRGLWPFPDIAVLELDAPVPEHPCVWLDDRLPSRGPGYVALGYSTVYEDDPACNEEPVEYGGDLDFNEGRMLKLTKGEVVLGMSGGPLFNPRTCGICAIIKVSRMPDTPMGGLASPVAGIRLVLTPDKYREVRRAHDRYHDEHREWVDLTRIARHKGSATGEQLGGLEPLQDVKLRGILAKLDPPTNPDKLFREMAGMLPAKPRYEMHDHGDVVSSLQELNPAPDDKLPYLIALAADLHRTLPPGDLQKALYTWVINTTGWLKADVEEVQALMEAPPEPRAAGSVIVRLRPDGHMRAKIHWTAWHCVDGEQLVLVEDEKPGALLHEALAQIEQTLDAHLALLAGEGPALVEFVVPLGLMNERFEDLRPWERRRGSTLRRTHPVVVRDLDRFESDTRLQEWQRRYAELKDTDITDVLTRFACDDLRGDVSMEGWLESSGLGRIPVLSGPPSGSAARVAAEAAIWAGVPVLVWPRGGCDGCSDGSGTCPGKQFYGDLRKRLRGTRISQLPGKVKILRAEADQRSKDAAHCGRSMVLLWDDPRRRPAPHVMISPGRGADPL